MRRGVAGVVLAGVVLAAVVLAAVVLGGCGSSSTESEPAASKPGSPTVPPTHESSATTVAPEPAGVDPSAASVMVCSDEAQEDIAAALGVKPTRVTAPTWADHVYSCRYEYPNGVLTLSVKELSSELETTGYFDERGTTLDRLPESVVLGQGAFHTTNGSFVVRKDYKVLEVDVSGLPKEFGKLGLARDVVARNVGEVIMGCWVDA
jgi:hypothetical protein